MAYRMFGQSPSSISTFLTCPRRFEGKYFLKEDPFVESDASRYGDRFHTCSQDYLVKRTPASDEFRHLVPVFDSVLRWPGQLLVEHELSVDKSLREQTSWKGRTLGGRIDLLSLRGTTAVIGDWKTGRSDYEDPLQVSLNALTVFAAYRQVDRIDATYIYTKGGKVGRRYRYYRHDEDAERDNHPNKTPLSHLVQQTEHTLLRMQTMHMSGVFPKQRNGLCRKHCPIRSCQFNGGYKGT